MQDQSKLSFFTLLLLISFASVNAVLFTPALPDIINFFAISSDSAQQTITWFLVGYTFGQLIYGPIANRYGRKPALYIGIGLQIVSSLLCVYSGIAHQYALLILGRFLLALGSGVGLKITFTLINECYPPKIASQKTSYLLLAFAVTPAIGVAIGGILNTYFDWTSCFYGGALYGTILLALVSRLPETKKILNYDALKMKNLLPAYIVQFRNIKLISGGFLMGSSTSFVYVFAALAPYIAMNLLGMNSTEYGIANLLPAVGLALGSLLSAELTKRIPLPKIIYAGILIIGGGIFMMFLSLFLFKELSALYSLFLPMVIIYFGLSFVLSSTSTVVMNHVSDKSQGSAVMNFINMGIATITVLCIGFFNTNIMVLPLVYLILFGLMMGIFRFIPKHL